mgnify:CR=1 FL=1
MNAVDRRRFLGTCAGGAGVLGLTASLPAWARGASLHGGMIRPGFDEVSGRSIDLTIGEGPRVVQGRRGHAIGIGHPHPQTLAALEAWLATTENQNVRVASLSEMVTIIDLREQRQ